MATKCLPLELLYEIVPLIPAENATPNALSSCRLLHKLLLPRVIKWKEIMSENTGFQKQLLEMVKALHEKVAVIEKSVAIIEKNVAVIEKKATVIEKNVTVIEKEVTVIEKNVTVIEKEVTVIKKTIGIKGETTGVVEQQFHIRETVPTKNKEAGNGGNGRKRSLSESCSGTLKDLEQTLHMAKLQKFRDIHFEGLPAVSTSRRGVWAEGGPSAIEIYWTAEQEARPVKHYFVQRMDKGRWINVSKSIPFTGQSKYCHNFLPLSLVHTIEYSFRVITVFVDGQEEASETFTGRLTMNA